MYTLEYTLTTAKNFIAEMAAQSGAETLGCKLTIPTELGTGYYRASILADGLEIIFNEMTINRDILLKRNKSDSELYSLRLEELDIKHEYRFQLDKEYIIEPAQKRAGVILTNCLYNFEFLVRADTSFRAIYILIQKKWLTTFLGDEISKMLIKYLDIKSAKYNIKVMDTGYRTILNEILAEDDANPFYTTTITNKVQLLLEKYFTDLIQFVQEGASNTLSELSDDEIRRLMHVEANLVSDFSKPAPTITELSRLAAMSQTNLKKKFRLAYNHSIYEYFQKNRMAKARMLILSGEYNIKQIGQLVGYQNLSNFTIAFKKEYNLLPSQLTS